MKRAVEVSCPDCGGIVAVVEIVRESDACAGGGRAEAAQVSYRHDCSIPLVGRERVPLKVRLG